MCRSIAVIFFAKHARDQVACGFNFAIGEMLLVDGYTSGKGFHAGNQHRGGRQRVQGGSEEAEKGRRQQ
jgi:hypothetical protein